MPEIDETTDTEAPAPEPTEGEVQALGSLAAMVEAMSEQLDKDDVSPGHEPQAWRDACTLLGRDPRRGGVMPVFVREDGSYALVVVFSRSSEDDKLTLEEQKLSPAELLTEELNKLYGDDPATHFAVAEPSHEVAQSFHSDSLYENAHACTTGAKALPMVRYLLRHLGSRNAETLEDARAKAKQLLEMVGH